MQNYFLGVKIKVCGTDRVCFRGRLVLVRSWTRNDCAEAMLVPHGKWECLAMKISSSVWFQCVTIVRPTTHA